MTQHLTAMPFNPEIHLSQYPMKCFNQDWMTQEFKMTETTLLWNQNSKTFSCSICLASLCLLPHLPFTGLRTTPRPSILSIGCGAEERVVCGGFCFALFLVVSSALLLSLLCPSLAVSLLCEMMSSSATLGPGKSPSQFRARGIKSSLSVISA